MWVLMHLFSVSLSPSVSHHLLHIVSFSQYKEQNHKNTCVHELRAHRTSAVGAFLLLIS